MELQPPYPAIARAFAEGKVIPFLGAGASLGNRNPTDNPWIQPHADGIPLANELAEFLGNESAFPADEAARELSKIAQYYELMVGRDPLEDLLHKVFNFDFRLNDVHEFLAAQPKPLIIVTTNYDDLMERALTARGREYDVVIHSTDPRQGEHLLYKAHGSESVEPVLPNAILLDLNKRTVVYKMHGAVHRRIPTNSAAVVAAGEAVDNDGGASRGQYVITEDDYIDFLTRMTRSSALPAVFAEPFQRRPFLFLGYGLKDWNLRIILRRINRDRPKSIKSWAVQHQASTFERTFWQQHGVVMFSMPIPAFLTGVRAATAPQSPVPPADPAAPPSTAEATSSPEDRE